MRVRCLWLLGFSRAAAGVRPVVTQNAFNAIANNSEMEAAWLDAASEEEESDDDVELYRGNMKKYGAVKQRILNDIPDLGVRVTFGRRLDDIEGRLSQPCFAGPVLDDALRRAMAEARSAAASVPWQKALFPRPP